MKVYVAAKFEEAVLARAVMTSLEGHGHTITHDWTRENEAGRTGDALHEYLGTCAHGDLEGVLAADAVVILHHDKLCGGLVEMGAALADPDRVIVVSGAASGKVQPIFYKLPRVQHVASPHEAVKALCATRRDWP